MLAITTPNGISEELYFRGALFAAIPDRIAVPGDDPSTPLVTATAAIPLLTLAAVAVGLVTALHRRVTGGVLGPIVTHLTWSIGMLLALGPLLNAGVQGSAQRYAATVVPVCRPVSAADENNRGAAWLGRGRRAGSFGEVELGVIAVDRFAPTVRALSTPNRAMALPGCPSTRPTSCRPG